MNKKMSKLVRVGIEFTKADAGSHVIERHSIRQSVKGFPHGLSAGKLRIVVYDRRNMLIVRLKPWFTGVYIIHQIPSFNF
jgi:hypothetical protein